MSGFHSSSLTTVSAVTRTKTMVQNGVGSNLQGLLGA